MTDQDEELRRLAEAATPGPWRYELDGPKSNDMRHAVLAEITDLWIVACYRSGTTPEDDSSEAADAEAEANARLIAAANPAAVLSLLDRLEVVERDAARWREAVGDAWYKSGLDIHGGSFSDFLSRVDHVLNKENKA